VLVLEGTEAATSLAFTPDSTRLLAGRPSRLLDIWVLATGQRSQLAGPSHGGYDRLAVHPAGRFVFVAADPHLLVVSLSAPTYQRFIDLAGVRSVAVSADGQWAVAATSKDSRLVGLWCEADGSLLPGCQRWETLPHASYHILGGFVGSGDQFVNLDNKLLVIRDTATGEVRSAVTYPESYFRSITVSPDGSRVAVQGADTIYLWDTATWSEPLLVTDYTAPFEALVFHPKRPILAGACRSPGGIRQFDTVTGKAGSELQWDIGELRGIAFSPDGTLAAAGSASGKIVVWDVD
jgi:WD40 repeat protein